MRTVVCRLTAVFLCLSPVAVSATEPRTCAEVLGLSGDTTPHSRPTDLAVLLGRVFGKEHRPRLAEEVGLRGGVLLQRGAAPWLDARVEALVDHPVAFPPQFLTNKDPRFWDALLLLSLLPSLKEVVWRAGTAERTAFAAAGIDAAKLWNTYDPDAVGDAVRKVLATPELASWVQRTIEGAVQAETGHTLDKIVANPELVRLYADELMTAFGPAASKLASANLGAKKAEGLAPLLALLRAADTTLSVAPRDFEGLLGGERAGDCTAPGGVNAWTTGTWLLAMEAVELRTKWLGKFFARFVAIAGESDAGPVLFVHAVEFTPLVRPGKTTAKASRLAESEVQREGLETSLRAVLRHARRAGFRDVFLTNVSNSRDFSPLIVRTAASQVPPVAATTRRFRLLDGFSSVFALQEELRGDTGPVQVLLQDWNGNTFRRRGETPETEEINSTIVVGDKRVPSGDVVNAANALWHLLEARLRRSLDGLPLKINAVGDALSPLVAFDSFLANEYRDQQGEGLGDQEEDDHLLEAIAELQPRLARWRELGLVLPSLPPLPELHPSMNVGEALSRVAASGWATVETFQALNKTLVDALRDVSRILDPNEKTGGLGVHGTSFYETLLKQSFRDQLRSLDLPDADLLADHPDVLLTHYRRMSATTEQPASRAHRPRVFSLAEWFGDR